MKVLIDKHLAKDLVVYAKNGSQKPWVKLTDICQGEPFVVATRKKPALLVRRHTDGSPGRFTVFTVDASQKISVIKARIDAREFVEVLSRIDLTKYQHTQGEV